MIDDAARTSFATAGFCQVRGVFSPELVERLRRALDAERLAYLAGERVDDPRYTHASIKSVQVISNMWRIVPELADLAVHARLARCAAELSGIDRLRVYHDSMLHKSIENAPVPWHQDEYYALIDDLVTAWLPLVPVDASTGSLVYARGSHRDGVVNVRGRSDAEVDDALRARYERCTTALQPGDALFHFGRIFHRSERPERALDRLAFSVFMFRDGQRLRAQPYGTELVDLKYFPGRAIGDVADSAFNPIVYPVVVV